MESTFIFVIKKKPHFKNFCCVYKKHCQLNIFLGGPLEQGDIEDFDGREKIVCPWHSYDFDLETGDSSYGLTVSQKEKRSINKTKDN